MPKSKTEPKARPKARSKAKRAAKPRRTRISPVRLEQASGVLRALRRAVPDPRCELDHRDAWSLLVSTILSAQSTDKMVNRVTPALFARWPTPAALAAAPQEEVEEVVHATGFFRNKAKAIRGAAQVLVERFGGRVPRTMEEMQEIPGVARKTANVVLGTAYGIASGVTVDTHATRVAGRLGLTKHADPVRIEQDLMALFPAEEWIDLGHRLVLHGRYTCLARGPRCGDCACADVCPSSSVGAAGGVSPAAKRVPTLARARRAR